MTEDVDRAMERAMKMLTFRARSRREVSDRLLSLGFNHGTVGVVDLRLVELGWVNDVEYALERVRHLLAKGTASRAARIDLERLGLDQEAVRQALLELEAGGSESDRAKALAQNRAAGCAGLPADRAFQRVARYLCSKGYAPEVAAQACRSVFGDTAESD
ncbi:MAG: regulatory protein RecX [Actinomycetota bacterium]